ncbi:hypothetical protein MASR1M32_30070 [Rhodobacter sp.]
MSPGPPRSGCDHRRHFGRGAAGRARHRAGRAGDRPFGRGLAIGVQRRRLDPGVDVLRLDAQGFGKGGGNRIIGLDRRDRHHGGRIGHAGGLQLGLFRGQITGEAGAVFQRQFDRLRRQHQPFGGRGGAAFGHHVIDGKALMVGDLSARFFGATLAGPSSARITGTPAMSRTASL